jgi:hypothetical protein
MNWRTRGEETKAKASTDRYEMLSEVSIDIDKVLSKDNGFNQQEEMDKILEVMSEPDSETSHVSVMIDDALSRKVEKEVSLKDQAKKTIALSSGLVLTQDIIKDVKIDKSLDRIFKGFCNNM